MAVSHQVPGVLAVEDGVRIEAAPCLPLAPQGAIEQRNGSLFTNGPFEQWQQSLPDGAGALRARQRQGLRRFFQFPRRRVQFPLQRRGQFRGGSECRMLQQQLQRRAFRGCQAEPANGGALDQPVAVLVARDRDALQATEVLQIAIYGSLGNVEMMGDFGRSPGTTPAKELEYLDEANRTVHVCPPRSRSPRTPGACGLRRGGIGAQVPVALYRARASNPVRDLAPSGDELAAP